MMGDSNIIGMFTSLGCLMRKHADGEQRVWSDPLNTMTRLAGPYSDRGGREILLQVFAVWLTTCEFGLSSIPMSILMSIP